MPPKFSVIRSVTVAAVSTLLVVGVGVMVTLSGGGLPGVADLANEQRVSGATLPQPPEETAPAPVQPTTPVKTVSPADKAMNALVKSVERQVGKRARAGTSEPAPTAPARTAAGSALGRAGNTGATPYSFTLASFNILGSQHTAPGGDARGFAPGRMRAEWAARLVQARGADIVGWSEMQSDQYAAMMSATRGAYEAWPGTQLGAKGIPASMMWRTSMWEAVWKGTVTIPFMGQQRPMPVVQLRHRATGRELFAMNIHNAPQGRESERNRAEAAELDLVRTLRRESGLPVLLFGDFNEKAEIFCTVTGTTDLLSASGGSNNGTCRPPSGMRVDWIFGSPDARFSGYVADRSAEVRRITDHAALFTGVTVD